MSGIIYGKFSIECLNLYSNVLVHTLALLFQDIFTVHFIPGLFTEMEYFRKGDSLTLIRYMRSHVVYRLRLSLLLAYSIP